MKLVETLNQCILTNRCDEFLELIKTNPDTFLAEIDASYAGSLYFLEFKYIRDEKQTPLDLEDFQHGIKVLNSVVDINRMLDSLSDVATTTSMSDPMGSMTSQQLFDPDELDVLMLKLAQPNAHLQDVRAKNEILQQRYAQSLLGLRRLKNNNNTLEPDVIVHSNGKNGHNGHNGHNNSSSNGNGHDKKTTNASLSDDSEDSSDMSNCSSGIGVNGGSSGVSSSSSGPACNLLTHGEIQDCITHTNADFEQECLGNNKSQK